MKIKSIKNFLTNKIEKMKTKFYEKTKALFINQKKEEDNTEEDNADGEDSSEEDNLFERILQKMEEEPIKEEEKVPIDRIYERAWNQALQEILHLFEYDKERQEELKKKINKEKEDLKNYILEEREKEINISSARIVERELIEELKNEMNEETKENLEEIIARLERKLQQQSIEKPKFKTKEIEQDFDER